jgi:hypothetical protein
VSNPICRVRGDDFPQRGHRRSASTGSQTETSGFSAAFVNVYTFRIHGSDPLMSCAVLMVEQAAQDPELTFQDPERQDRRR